MADSTTDTLVAARDAVRRRAWAEAYDLYDAVDRVTPLALDDLELFATTTHLMGREDEGVGLLVRAHQLALRDGATARAARCTFWLALTHAARGDSAQAAGWVRRGERLLRDQAETAEHGYLLVPTALQALEAGDFDAAHRTFTEVGEIADRFNDADLATLARLGQGDALIGRADTQRGLDLLDEAMVAVSTGELSPAITGIAYCSVIESCQRLFDLRRAQEWTAALTRWVDDQPQLVAFRGQCLLRRAELMTLHGSWREANDELARARDRLAGPPPDPALGAACYLDAELHRLRGEFAAAEQAYREAARHGHRPEPGLALLRLAQGRASAATAAIDRSLTDSHDPMDRPALLAARVDISLAAGELQPARAAAGELAQLADAVGAPLLRAMAATANGAVTLAEGDVRAALGVLRQTWAAWIALEAPYQAARVRVLLGIACRRAGDEDAAQIEFEAATETFARLAAKPDSDALARLVSARPRPGGLSERELDVLRLVAAGKSNRAIAHELAISEKTVARHVSNILTKLDLTSRAAATAYAYQHEVV
jgi:DNA-binding NarL/FixJ family response regulator